MFDKLLHWVTTSPVGAALKVGVVGVLVYLLDHVTALGVSDALLPFVTAVLVVALNWLNPVDVRYGHGASAS